jgi:alpha-glucosidase
VPIPWGGTTPPYAFGPGTGQPWIPQPDDWDRLTVEAQQADPASTLSFYREALAIRRRYADTAGDAVELLETPTDVLAFERGPLRVLVNCGKKPVPLPRGEVVIASGPVPEGMLPPDTAVWLS